MSIVPPLRILFIALAIVFGIGLAAASVIGALEFVLQPPAPAPDGGTVSGVSADGPVPFRFSDYAYTPIIAAVAILSGLAALRRRWEGLALTCWFLLGGTVLEALYSIWSLGWRDLIPASIPGIAAIVWAFFPILGLALGTIAKSGGQTLSDMPAASANRDKIGLRNTLVGLAVVSYLWRIVTITLSPGSVSALAYFRGTVDEYLILGSIVDLGAAILLLVGIVRSRKESDRFISAALAFTAGLAFEGFLDALDVASGFTARLELAYALQDAVAFVACCAALALSAHAGGRSPRHA